jgi:hypothetical protein
LTHRPLAREPWVIPVGAKVRGFGNFHSVNQAIATLALFCRTARSNYPVTDKGSTADGGFAGNEGAETVEWVWRKSAIVSNDV